MSRTKIVLACVFLCSALLMKAAAQNLIGIPVIGTIGDSFSLKSDGVNPLGLYTGFGVYPNSKSVQSVMLGVGDWHLITDYAPSKTPPRRLGIDFGTNPPLIPGLSDGKGFFTGGVWTDCYGYNGANGPNMLTMHTKDEFITCTLLVNFYDSNGTKYRIWMGDHDYARSNPATITCTAATGGQCSHWTIVPSVSGGNVGTLTKSKSPNKGPWIDMGDYNFSFSMELSYQ